MLLTGPALTQFLMERSGQEWDCVSCFGGYRAGDFTFIALKNLYEKANGTKMRKEDLLSLLFRITADVLLLMNRKRYLSRFI